MQRLHKIIVEYLNYWLFRWKNDATISESDSVISLTDKKQNTYISENMTINAFI